MAMTWIMIILHNAHKFIHSFIQYMYQIKMKKDIKLWS